MARLYNITRTHTGIRALQARAFSRCLPMEARPTSCVSTRPPALPLQQPWLLTSPPPDA